MARHRASKGRALNRKGSVGLLKWLAQVSASAVLRELRRDWFSGFLG